MVNRSESQEDEEHSGVPEDTGIVEYRLQQIAKRSKQDIGIQTLDQNENENEIDTGNEEEKKETMNIQDPLEKAKEQTQIVNLMTIVDWLKDTMVDDEQEELLKTSYIFLSTHRDSLQEYPSIYKSLIDIHKQLKGNVKYKKLIALERLNQDAYSNRYRALN